MNQDSLAERHNATAGRHPVSKMCSKYAPMVTQLKTDMLHITKRLQTEKIGMNTEMGDLKKEIKKDQQLNYVMRSHFSKVNTSSLSYMEPQLKRVAMRSGDHAGTAIEVVHKELQLIKLDLEELKHKRQKKLKIIKQKLEIIQGNEIAIVDKRGKNDERTIRQLVNRITKMRLKAMAAGLLHLNYKHVRSYIKNEIEKFPKTLREINESMKKVKTEVSTNLKELEHVKTSLQKFMIRFDTESQKTRQTKQRSIDGFREAGRFVMRYSHAVSSQAILNGIKTGKFNITLDPIYMQTTHSQHNHNETKSSLESRRKQNVKKQKSFIQKQKRCRENSERRVMNLMHAKVSKLAVNDSKSENFIDTRAKRYQILKKFRNTKDNRENKIVYAHEEHKKINSRKADQDIDRERVKNELKMYEELIFKLQEALNNKIPMENPEEAATFFHEHTEKHHEIFMESKLKELKLQKEKKKSRKLIDQLENVKFVQEERTNKRICKIQTTLKFLDEANSTNLNLLDKKIDLMFLLFNVFEVNNSKLPTSLTKFDVPIEKDLDRFRSTPTESYNTYKYLVDTLRSTAQEKLSNFISRKHEQVNTPSLEEFLQTLNPYQEKLKLIESMRLLEFDESINKISKVLRENIYNGIKLDSKTNVRIGTVKESSELDLSSDEEDHIKTQKKTKTKF